MNYALVLYHQETPGREKKLDVKTWVVTYSSQSPRQGFDAVLRIAALHTPCMHRQSQRDPRH